MKAAQEQPSARELVELRARLAEAKETLHAIRRGEVDAVVVAGKQGDQVFTLQGAEHPYRVLIESMNEGALTLTEDGMILYANQCFSKMVQHPLERIMGSSFLRFLSEADQIALQRRLRSAGGSSAKMQVHLSGGSASPIPVQISIRPLAEKGRDRAPIGMVLTDMREALRTEELLRALTHRVVHAQETERGRVALELHDHITQLACAILFRSQALAGDLAVRDRPLKKAAMKISAMLRRMVREVERISHNLRPSILDQLGLASVLRATSADFARRTGVPIKLACGPLAAELPSEAGVTLYRIFQEALKNVEKHACARRVMVSLTQPGAFVRLAISDDGIGFDPDRRSANPKRMGGLGLLGMHERAASVGGTFKIKSSRRAGTVIEVRIPLQSGDRAARSTVR